MMIHLQTKLKLIAAADGLGPGPEVTVAAYGLPGWQVK